MPACLRGTMRRPITAGGGGTRCPAPPPGPFQAGGGRWQAPLAPPARGLLNWICWRWQNCRRPERRGALLSQRLSRCHGKARGEWFSVASDFQYLFSIRPTYLREKKQHVERKWQAETRSLAPPFSPRSVFKQGGPITLKAPDQPHSIIATNPYSSIK